MSEQEKTKVEVQEEQEDASPASEAETTDTAQDGGCPKEEASEETAEQAESSEDEKDAQNPEEKGFFKKKKKKADPKEEKIAELTEHLQRQLAEFDNFRKRTEKEKASMYQVGAKDVIEKILPVIDNFERALGSQDTSDPFVDGMNMIYKQMLQLLSELGVTQIEAVGKEFDSKLHNAVMHVEDEAFGENIVAEEFQKGYLYKDIVVRHSMVKVAN